MSHFKHIKSCQKLLKIIPFSYNVSLIKGLADRSFKIGKIGTLFIIYCGREIQNCKKNNKVAKTLTKLQKYLLNCKNNN